MWGGKIERAVVAGEKNFGQWDREGRNSYADVGGVRWRKNVVKPPDDDDDHV